MHKRKIMQKFYIADKEILKLELPDQQFKVYNYWCSQYNVKTHKAFINYVQTASDLSIKVDTIKNIITKLCEVSIGPDPLLSVVDNREARRVEFDLPRYRSFLKSIGFLGYNSAKGWTNIQNYLKKDIVDTKVYKFKNLDQYQLFDHLRDLPDEEFNKIQASDLLYPWVIKQVRYAK